MRNFVLIGSLTAAALIAVACGSTESELFDESSNDSGSTSQSGDDSTTTDSDAGETPVDTTPIGDIPSDGGAGTGAFTGIPCNVQQVLENACLGCHTKTYAPVLLNYSDLIAKSVKDPAKSNAERSLARMQDTASPMPPKPAAAATAEEIAAFDAWIKAGSPMGAACTGIGDGGAPKADAGDPYNTPTVCTSKSTYRGGENIDMRPGEACATCHQVRGGPRYTVGGTVYPTAHEPNLCNGATKANLTVIVTDKNGKVVNVPVDTSSGNFGTRTAIVPPFTVVVSDGTKTRPMLGSLTAGDCNTCHTEKGLNGAPGRVMAP